MSALSTSSGLAGSISGLAGLNNAGHIAGGNGVSVTLNAAASNLIAVNSGHISAVSETTGSAAFVAKMQVTGAKLQLTNSGVIEAAGAAHGISLTSGGAAVINNSGVISVAGATAYSVHILNSAILKMYNSGAIVGDIQSAGTLVLRNSGDITGDIRSTGTISLRNSGTIDGSISLGFGNDTVQISGLVDGDVILGDGSNSFTLRGGVVTGTVVGGQGTDQYFIDRADIKIIDAGGLQDYLASTVDVQVYSGIETTELMGFAGLRAVGTFLGETIISNGGDDTLLGQGGNDSLRDGGGNDALFAGEGNDSILGMEGDDLLVGGAGNDTFTINPQAGADTIRGGSGTDLLDMRALFDQQTVLIVNLTTGVARFDADNTSSVSGIENVTGSFYADVITGDALANRLDGHYGNDTLIGGAGNDTLTGHEGADVITGGSGADHFVFSVLSWSNGSAVDTINGFSLAEDVIDLSGLDAVPGGANDAFTFIGTAAFAGTGPQVRIAVDEILQKTTVEVRLDGAVTNSMTIALDNDLMLTASNFLL